MISKIIKWTRQKFTHLRCFFDDAFGVLHKFNCFLLGRDRRSARGYHVLVYDELISKKWECPRLTNAYLFLTFCPGAAAGELRHISSTPARSKLKSGA